MYRRNDTNTFDERKKKTTYKIEERGKAAAAAAASELVRNDSSTKVQGIFRAYIIGYTYMFIHLECISRTTFMCSDSICFYSIFPVFNVYSIELLI